MIEGKKVNLRLFKEEDLDEYLEAINKYAEIGEFWPAYLMSETHVKKDFKNDGIWEEHRGRMLIEDKEKNKVGSIEFFKGIPYSEGYEIGYNIYKSEERGKGYGSEALKLFVDYMFNLRQLNRFQLTADVENIASQKVAEKNGFVREGTLRSVAFNRGRFRDLHIYSMLRSEWESNNCK